MKRLVLVLGSIATACGGGTTAAPTTTATPTSPARVTPAAPAAPARDTSALQAAIEQGILPPVKVKGDTSRTTLVDLMARNKIPAVSIAVFENYELVWARAYGLADASLKIPANESTVFLAGSISKSVNALAVLGAVADGTLALDRPVNELLTSWKLPDNELQKGAPVTIRRLLSHTAGTTVHGFPGYTDGTPVPTLVQVLDGLPPANTAPVRVDLKPGARFRYSGGGTSITQLALVDRLGAPYPTILRDRVLEPLHMGESTFEQPLPRWRVARAAAGYRSDGSETPGKRNVYPEMAAAGLWTTPSDLARFFIEVARARAGTSTLVPRELAVEMTTPQTTDPDRSIGMGVFISDRNGTKVFGHGGADDGFQADVVATLEGGNGVVIMSNSDNGFQIFPAIERTVFGAMGWKGADPVIERAPLTDAERARVTGRYLTLEHQAFTVAVAGDALTIARPFGEPSELVPLGGVDFVSAADGMRYTFDGKSAFEIHLSPDRRGLAARLPPDKTAPLFELEAGRVDAGIASLKKRAAASTEAARTLEAFHNVYAYQLLDRGKTDAAITIFSAIVVAFPDSSNAQDSYGEALLKKGDKAAAITAYEKAIELLARDPRVPPPERPARRTRAESQLAKLRDPR
jgi:CubicO group peptidase (beta-lactamase class C family)